ncbi:hypothetical protein RFI_22556 [Reticulomyxa filosa]|uniref:Rab3-GAP regulatory subunit N-terminal domain-containing protein n=1 Tax=Reticulomyxa filosa TaxID=46433 RepID=X6MLS1_RETFI|nr:hypothetical protein RFI_22556 [Reticulomyxa filosa]|eukprot:ETO14814.1 hypothetical protein RFI_22556 [Reticulomyxa filosa]
MYSLNHDLTLLAYLWFDSTLYNIVIKGNGKPNKRQFRKKVTCLKWIYVDKRDILLVSFEHGYIGCFDKNGHCLFKQQVEDNAIIDMQLVPPQEEVNTKMGTSPNIFCKTWQGIIIISCHDIYKTLKCSNFDTLWLTEDQKRDYYFEQQKLYKQQQQQQQEIESFTVIPGPTTNKTGL